MKADKMRQRLVQVLKREDDIDSHDVVAGRFWASAKPLRRSPRIPGESSVVDLAQWIAALDVGRRP
jgi:hypothetical protein